MTSLNKFLLDTFYQLQREFPADIIFTKVVKADVNPETGKRDASGDLTYSLKSVLHPVVHTTEFLVKLLGRVESTNSIFLIRNIDLPVKVEAGDYFTHKGLKYKNLVFEDFDGVLTAMTGEVVQ